MFDEISMNARVDSNISVQRDIAWEILGYIKTLASEAMSVHPEYEDSFPPTLKKLRDARNET